MKSSITKVKNNNLNFNKLLGVEKNAKTEEDALMASLEYIKSIFEKIKKNTSITEFKDGLSSYLSGNYYKYRSKKSGSTETELKILEKKLKVAMDLLSGSVLE